MQKTWNISREQNNMLHIRIPQNNTLKEHKNIYTFLTISISTHSPSSSGLKTRLFLSRTNLGKTQDFENKVLRNKGIGILSEKEELSVNFPRSISAPAQHQFKSCVHSVRQYFPLNPKTFFSFGDHAINWNSFSTVSGIQPHIGSVPIGPTEDKCLYFNTQYQFFSWCQLFHCLATSIFYVFDGTELWPS